jgi:plastocyanin
MKTFVAALALASVLLIGQSATASQPGPAQASAAKSVNIKHFAYHPGTLRVSKGTQVVFSNASGTAHTATDKGIFDTGHIKPGRSVGVRFARKGTFAYHCTIHPFMHGKIVVG